MFTRYLLPLIALAGLAFAVITTLRAERPVAVAAPVSQPARPPYESYVAGSGLVEARSENIAVAAPEGGLVQRVVVGVGARVRAGDVLFELDDRNARAELATREGDLAVARAELARLVAQPRPEDVPPARAAADAARAALASAQSDLDLAEAVKDPRAISTEDLARRRAQREQAFANLARAEADLARLLAGAWGPDLEVSRARLAASQAAVDAARIELDRLVVRAPVDGEVLQSRARPGQYAPAAATALNADPLMLLGDTSRLHVRVDVDEHDAWRVAADSRARAFLRGHPELSTDLEFVRFEPYVLPKRSLTGDATERVDTRVLQVIFAFDRKDLPVFVGQQMDVFIESPAVPAPTAAALDR